MDEYSVWNATFDWLEREWGGDAGAKVEAIEWAQCMRGLYPEQDFHVYRRVDGVLYRVSEEG